MLACIVLPDGHQQDVPQGATMIDNTTHHQAINRLFDLACRGEVENLEFSQLDSLIYGGLERTYRVDDMDVEQRHVRTAAA